MRHDHRQAGMAYDLSYERIAPLNIRGMLRVLWYGKWMIVSVTAISVFFAGYYAFRMTSPQFAATATLQLDAHPSALREVARQWPDPATDAASLNTQVQVLTSDWVLRDVIAELDLMKDPEFNRYLNPVSPLALNTLRAQFREAVTGIKEPSPNAEAITQKTIANLRGRLSVHRPNDTFLFQITAQSRDANKAASIANSVARASVTAQVAARETAADDAIDWLTQKVSSLQSQLVDQETAVTTLIATVQIQEEAALDTLSTAVLAIDQERETVAATLAMHEISNPASARQTAEMTQLRDQIAEIDARRGRLQAQLASQSAGMVTLQQMQREADTTRVLYQSFLSRLQETQVQRGLAYADSRLLTPAMAGGYVGPQKILIMLAALLLGGLLGIVLVILRQNMRRGFDTPQALQQGTGRAVYAQICKRWTGQNHIELRKQVRKIQAGLLLDGQGEIPQVTVITSSMSHEACVEIGFGLAQEIGTADRKVLVVHASDRRAQKLMRQMGNTHVSNKAMPVFEVSDIGEVITAWRAEYAQIIILAPPVLTDIETQLLAQNSDAILYTVRWGKTAQTAVLEGLERIMQASDAPIGLVLTQANQRKMRRFAAIQGGAAPASILT